MNLFLLDAIGPFFRGLKPGCINWSKIPFALLPCPTKAESRFWRELEDDFRKFATKARDLGYTAITLDDLAHLTPHPWHDEATNHLIEAYLVHFRKLFAIAQELELEIWITADVLSLSKTAEERVGKDHETRSAFFNDLVNHFLQSHPEIAGLILRIGESDGLDVVDSLRSHLHLRTPEQVNHFLQNLIPIFEKHQRLLILRTWTVGAHRIGDLIWHRGRLSHALEGINSDFFIVSMKPGESDFFRHIPLNQAFFRYSGKMLLELQARREYEGAGEFPSWLGPDCEQLHRDLSNVGSLVGISVWCQTGGWHRFRRLTFLDEDALWSELNTRIVIDIFRYNRSSRESLELAVGTEKADAAQDLLDSTLDVILNTYYLPAFANQKLFFRRVRIPPLLHIYWDSLYIHAPIRRILRHFVDEPRAALQQTEEATSQFPRLIELAHELDWQPKDIEFMRDTCELITLAYCYYFSPRSQNLEDSIREAKKKYKKSYPNSLRARYRIKLDFSPPPLTARHLSLGSQLLLRRKRGYRLFDHLVTLRLLSFLYRLFKNHSQRTIPDSMRNSAMGIDSIFE